MEDRSYSQQEYGAGHQRGVEDIVVCYQPDSPKAEFALHCMAKIAFAFPGVFAKHLCWISARERFFLRKMRSMMLLKAFGWRASLIVAMMNALSEAGIPSLARLTTHCFV